jgi:hypothetical protein
MLCKSQRPCCSSWTHTGHKPLIDQCFNFYKACIFLFVSTKIVLIIVLPVYWTHYCVGYLFVTGSISIRRILWPRLGRWNFTIKFEIWNFMCSKRYRQHVHLLCRIHTHKWDRAFKCEMCGSCFTSNSNLAVHKSTSILEKFHTLSSHVTSRLNTCWK